MILGLLLYFVLFVFIVVFYLQHVLHHPKQVLMTQKSKFNGKIIKKNFLQKWGKNDVNTRHLQFHLTLKYKKRN